MTQHIIESTLVINCVTFNICLPLSNVLESAMSRDALVLISDVCGIEQNCQETSKFYLGYNNNSKNKRKGNIGKVRRKNTWLLRQDAIY